MGGNSLLNADGTWALHADGTFAVTNADGECPECCGGVVATLICAKPQEGSAPYGYWGCMTSGATGIWGGRGFELKDNGNSTWSWRYDGGAWHTGTLTGPPVVGRVMGIIDGVEFSGTDDCRYCNTYCPPDVCGGDLNLFCWPSTWECDVQHGYCLQKYLPATVTFYVYDKWWNLIEEKWEVDENTETFSGILEHKYESWEAWAETGEKISLSFTCAYGDSRVFLCTGSSSDVDSCREHHFNTWPDTWQGVIAMSFLDFAAGGSEIFYQNEYYDEEYQHTHVDRITCSWGGVL